MIEAVGATRGFLESLIDVAENDLPQVGGPEATIIEQGEGALEALDQIETELRALQNEVEALRSPAPLLTWDSAEAQ